MTRTLILLGVLFVAGVAGGEDNVITLDIDASDWGGEAPWIVTPETEIYKPPSCITVDFCGDPEEDSNVRCVRAMVCGEPIR